MQEQLYDSLVELAANINNSRDTLIKLELEYQEKVKAFVDNYVRVLIGKDLVIYREGKVIHTYQMTNKEYDTLVSDLLNQKVNYQLVDNFYNFSSKNTPKKFFVRSVSWSGQTFNSTHDAKLSKLYLNFNGHFYTAKGELSQRKSSFTFTIPFSYLMNPIVEIG